VFDSDVDSLLEVAVSDWLVEDDADGGFGYVVDDSGLAMVEFVWHALLDGSVTHHIDDVSDFVLVEVGGYSDSSSLLEASREGVSCTGTETS